MHMQKAGSEAVATDPPTVPCHRWMIIRNKHAANSETLGLHTDTVGMQRCTGGTYYARSAPACRTSLHRIDFSRLPTARAPFPGPSRTSVDSCESCRGQASPGATVGCRVSELRRSSEILYAFAIQAFRLPQRFAAVRRGPRGASNSPAALHVRMQVVTVVGADPTTQSKFFARTGRPAWISNRTGTVIKSGVRTRTSVVLVQLGARRDNQHPAAGWSLSTAASRALPGGVWFHVVPDAVGSYPGRPLLTSSQSYMYISNKVPCNPEIPSSQSAPPCRLHRRIHGSITTCLVARLYCEPSSSVPTHRTFETAQRMHMHRGREWAVDPLHVRGGGHCW
jgi:hypothetical protein